MAPRWSTRRIAVSGTSWRSPTSCGPASATSRSPGLAQSPNRSSCARSSFNAWAAAVAAAPPPGPRPPAARPGRVRLVDGAMIVLYNPLSTTPGKQPLPLSLMSLAAVLGDERSWTLVDGNLIRDPASTSSRGSSPPSSRRSSLPSRSCRTAADTGRRRVPADQPAGRTCRSCGADTSRAARRHRARVGVRRFRGAIAGRAGAAAVDRGAPVRRITGPRDRFVVEDRDQRRPQPDRSARAARRVSRPARPRRHVAVLHQLPRPPHAAYNSSFGCPFACNFCSVVAMSNRRWIAQSPARMERTLRHLARACGMDAVQMHDMDFFISEPRTAEFAERASRGWGFRGGRWAGSTC